MVLHAIELQEGAAEILVDIIVDAIGDCEGCPDDATFTAETSTRRALEGWTDQLLTIGDHNNNNGSVVTHIRALTRQSFILPGDPTERQLLESYAIQIRSMNLPNIKDAIFMDEFGRDDCFEAWS